ncbi:MAG: DNA topoisomerase III [Rubrivivax sp.]|nr:DNA topoisomerase III [Rubrivivax sp.]
MATVKKADTTQNTTRLSDVEVRPPIKKSSPKKSTANAAFMKAMTPSPALSAVIGSTPLPRTEVTKQLWVYIKQHGLQDTKQRTMINADAKLLPIFQKPQVSMFEMTKLVNAHLS